MTDFNVKCMGTDVPLGIYFGSIEREKVVVERDRFSELCRTGCKNYNQKYCCPPKSIGFHEIHPEINRLYVIYMRCVLANVPARNPYHKIRVANVMMKSRLDKFLRDMKDEGAVVLGSGSCRACKDCGLKLGAKCKKPSRFMMSLEATGVNCQELVKSIFGINLEWYRHGEDCHFTSVVGGILSNEPLFAEEIIERLV